MGGKSEARPPSKDLTQLCQVGMAREDEEFFLLSHSNRKTGKQSMQSQQRPGRGRGLFDISVGNHFIMTVRFPNLSSQLLIPLHLHNIDNPQGKEIFPSHRFSGFYPANFTINPLR